MKAGHTVCSIPGTRRAVLAVIAGNEAEWTVVAVFATAETAWAVVAVFATAGTA
jgi:hypothetical protein